MGMAHTTTLDPATLERLYQVMVRIRRFDERTAELFNEGLVKGTAHSYVGEEAVATAVCAHLRPDDAIVGNHRGHGHCIAKGASLDRMEGAVEHLRDVSGGNPAPDITADRITA